ncbi:hypothetical protein ABPG72_002613 [Tetrahymena utriculariae]
MKSQLLIGATLIALSLTLFAVFNQTHHSLEDGEPKQTRDFLQLCVIKSCYHLINTCFADDSCKSELEQFQTSFLADYTQYDQLVASANHPALISTLKCQNDCGAREYFEDCGSVQSYIHSCPTNSDCVKENQEYFGNANQCVTRQYKACNGLTGEAYQICFLTENVYCFSDGISGTNTKYEDAILCA